MKKLLSVLLLAIMLIANVSLAEATIGEPTAAAAVEPTKRPETFDHTVFKGLDGYNYDKFDKKWSYHGAYVEEYADATVVIGVQADGCADYEAVVQLYCWIRDEHNRNALYTIEKMCIMADDALITCELDAYANSSMAPITSIHINVLKLISEAEEISFKLYYSDGGSKVFEPTKQEVEDFTTAAKNIYESNATSYSPLGYIFYSLDYPITIEY